MDWQALANALFPQGHSITEKMEFLEGAAQVDGARRDGDRHDGPYAHRIEIALSQAKAILPHRARTSGRPIVI